jgi:hypothetical protein
VTLDAELERSLITPNRLDDIPATGPGEVGLLRAWAVSGCPSPRSPGTPAAASRVWLVQPGGLGSRSTPFQASPSATWFRSLNQVAEFLRLAALPSKLAILVEEQARIESSIAESL